MRRSWLFAAAVVAAGVAGCAGAPYYDNGYAYNDYYAYPPYYVEPGPSVSFGYTYSDSNRWWDGRRWRDSDRRDGDRHWSGDNRRYEGRSFAPDSPAWNNGGHGSSTDSRG